MTVYCLYWHACVQVCFLNCCVVCVFYCMHIVCIHICICYVRMYTCVVSVDDQAAILSFHTEPRTNSTITCSYVLSQACMECVYSLGFCS